MGWDYIHEDYQKVDRMPFQASDAWTSIGIDLIHSKGTVRLSRIEWRLLQTFLRKVEFIDAEIPVHWYNYLPKNVRKVIADYMKMRLNP